MEKELLAVFLPKNVLKWFEIKEIDNNERKIQIVFEEKNVVPEVPKKHKGKKITAKSFKRILVDDFPIRGKKAELIFLRRRWQIEGEKKLLKRDIQLTAPGTTLAEEFADFLKELSR